MKVTKINENQVRCVINREDIVSRNTNLIELFHNKEKMHNLFTDMMEEVTKEYGDAYQDSGIMMEAVATFDGSIVVTLTKQDHAQGIEENTEDTEDTEDTQNKQSTPSDKNEEYIVYSFDNLPMVMQASNVLKEFQGKNTLYKSKKEKKYYLVFSMRNEDEDLLKSVYLLNDFGYEEKLSNVTIAYIMEHDTSIVRESAIQTLGYINV